MRKKALVAVVFVCTVRASSAALSFAPAPGYSASEMWRGANASHFAVDGGAYYILGTEPLGGGLFQNAVRLFDGADTVEIAASPTFSAGEYFPDAVTVVGGDVYWVHARSFASGGFANVFKTSYNSGAWTTTPVLDESAGINVYSLSTDGNRVFGVGLDPAGANVAFFLDDSDQYNVLATIPGFSGGSGFTPTGDFFAGAVDVASFEPHMYRFSAAQVADRVDGTRPTAYAAGEALADLAVPGNSSAVMESDGRSLFGTAFNATFTGSDPFAFDLDSGASRPLGTLSGAAASVSTDLYYRDGAIHFMGKDSFGTGDEAVIYRLVPEPESFGLLAAGVLLTLRRRRMHGAFRKGMAEGGRRRTARRRPPPNRRAQFRATSASRDRKEADAIGGTRRWRGVAHSDSPPPSRAQAQATGRIGTTRFLATVFSIALGAGGLATESRADSPFATAVADYDPAPGQFVNNSLFNDPASALGPPVGDDPSEPDNTSLVTLGGFGGSITLAFDHTVRDDPANPFGLDAIVFGNAVWVGGDPLRRWAECGVIEISRDANSNGQADDAWYLVPGSHVPDPPAQWEVHTWDDDVGDATYPPALASWIPPGSWGMWTTSGYRLPPGVFDVNVLVNTNGTEETVWGYADHSPTVALPGSESAEEFYTRPDDPFEVGLAPGSGGGDAFDITWAIDAATGQPAGLDGFDFIRIATGMDFIAGPFGELSTEIDAVADVAQGQFGDFDGDGVIDIGDYDVLQQCLSGPGSVMPAGLCRVMDFDQDGDTDLADYARFQVVFDAP